MKQLTKHFSLSEMTVTSTGLVNIPNCTQVNNLLYLCLYVLEPARVGIGMPIKVNSGFRCIKVNKAVGGKDNSQHPEGKAADLTCDDNAKLFNFIKDNLEFDQLIWEKGNLVSPKWVHVSFNKGRNRRQIIYIR